jgi:hypothetical protein
MPYHNSGLGCFLDRNTVFDKSDYYKVISTYQSSVIFGHLARYLHAKHIFPTYLKGTTM